MKKIMAGLAVTIFAVSILSGCSSTGGEAEVTVSAAKSGKDLTDMEWQGTIEALSTIPVMPNGSGRVVEIAVTEGQHVEKGDVLFQIDNADAGLSLQQAEAGYQAAEAAYNSSEKTSKQNTSVHPAEVAYQNAKSNFDRVQALYASGAVSQADYENARAQMESTASQLQAAKNGQDGSYEASRAQLASAKASLDLAKKRYDDCIVTAPVSGMVAKLSLEDGQMVSPQTSAATVIDDSGEKVLIQVMDTDIEQFSVGLPVNINVQPSGESCMGKISEISEVSDDKTGMFDVRVTFDQPSVKRTGLAANIRIAENEQLKSTYVPVKCVNTEDDGTSWVFAVSDGKAVKKAVTAGRKKNTYLEITDGIQPGDEVVIQSSKVLEDGMDVKVLTVK